MRVFSIVHEFEIDPGRAPISRWWTGAVTLEALVEGPTEVERHPHFDPRFDVLEDYSLARLVLSRDCLEQFRREWTSRGWKEVGRWASVMPHDLEFGIARQVNALWERDNAMAFRTREEALAWLGHRGEDTNQPPASA